MIAAFFGRSCLYVTVGVIVRKVVGKADARTLNLTEVGRIGARTRCIPQTLLVSLYGASDMRDCLAAWF